MLQRILSHTSSSTLSALTGLRRGEFDQLVVAFTQALREEEQARWAARERQRAAGGGRRGTLRTPEEKLLFILVHVRHYPVQRVQAVLFGQSQAQAWTWIHRLLPLLEQALGHAVALPLRPGASLEAMCTACPGLEAWVDATERPIRRPKDAERQRTYYSCQPAPNIDPPSASNFDPPQRGQLGTGVLVLMRQLSLPVSRMSQ